jgi:transcription antitermination factor NusA-like protein
MKAEGVMPNNQKIPGERFKLHDRVRAVVMEVKDGTRGPQIVLSRAHRNFLRRLLENEVPEIYHGIVEIRAISREPGARAKVAVSATQPGIDPVGACVGHQRRSYSSHRQRIARRKDRHYLVGSRPGCLYFQSHQPGPCERRLSGG